MKHTQLMIMLISVLTFGVVNGPSVQAAVLEHVAHTITLEKNRSI